MRNTRFKFSLRLLLVLVLFASLVFWRYCVRLEMASWASEIQDRGGRVVFEWQDPRLVKHTEIVTQSLERVVIDGIVHDFPPVPITVQRLHFDQRENCLLYTSPSPRDGLLSRMPSSA